MLNANNYATHQFLTLVLHSFVLSSFLFFQQVLCMFISLLRRMQIKKMNSSRLENETENMSVRTLNTFTNRGQRTWTSHFYFQRSGTCEIPRWSVVLFADVVLNYCKQHCVLYRDDHRSRRRHQNTQCRPPVLLPRSLKNLNLRESKDPYELPWNEM